MKCHKKNILFAASFLISAIKIDLCIAYILYGSKPFPSIEEVLRHFTIYFVNKQCIIISNSA